MSDQLRFDVQVDAGGFSGEEAFQTVKASLSSVDAEAVYDCFIGENGTADPDVYDNYSDPEGNQTPITVYEGADFSLAVSAKDFSWSNSVMNYVLNSFYPDGSTEEYNAEQYSMEDDLAFLDRKAAWEQVKETMETLGLDMDGAVSRVTYSLDVETLAQEERCIDVYGNVAEEEKNPSWSEKDEGYYYFITQSWEGIPFYDETYLNQDELTNAPMEVYQTQEGIAQAYLRRWFQIEPQEQTEKLADFESIMDVLEEKYTGTLQTYPITVEQATLYLFAVNTGTEGVYTLEPVWVCTLVQEETAQGEEESRNRFCVPIHAVTAEEMFILEN
ncbi:MAG: hypothetical protein Q4C82_07325 [Eubacteriales bacterium]|nr:hypothetical protein [Eubacteriales bacterium]